MGRRLIAFVTIVLLAIGAYATNELYNRSLSKLQDDSIWHQNLVAYQVDEPDASTTYIRYISGSGDVWIKKISISGTVTTIETAYDTWANRTTASYSAIND